MKKMMFIILLQFPIFLIAQHKEKVLAAMKILKVDPLNSVKIRIRCSASIVKRPTIYYNNILLKNDSFPEIQLNDKVIIMRSNVVEKFFGKTNDVGIVLIYSKDFILYN
jgi:hypothetical protein